MQIKAAIDIGTNSTRLLVAKVENGKVSDLHREARVTRLGQGVDENRTLAAEAIQRTIDVLKEYKTIAEKLGAESIVVGATSAARDAQNIDEFIEQTKEATGLTVEVLSAQEEARLSFKGATSSFSLRPQALGLRLLVIDIGGGSTELITGTVPSSHNGGLSSIALSYSKDIGSVRLTELFVKNDPPIREELEKAASHIHQKYEKAVEEIKKQSPKFQMIGVAGTVTTLAAINLGLTTYDPQKVHLSKLTLNSVKDIFENLKKLTTAQRKEIKVIQPGRADVIVMGALILLTLMKMLQTAELIVSETDILDGVLAKNYLTTNSDLLANI